MASRVFPIVGDSLELGYRYQRYWNQSIANAFFCGELGPDFSWWVCCTIR